MHGEDCTYIAHDDGLHEFVMLKSSRQAVDISLSNVFDVISRIDTTEIVPILMDMRQSGIPPLRYAMARAKEETQKYFANNKKTTYHTAGLAVVVSESSILHTFKFFLEQLARGSIKIKFFDNREDAVAWLFSEKFHAPLR